MIETCFVITPFGGEFDENYNQILIPAIEAAGYKPIRGDGFYGTRPVIEDVFCKIRGASVLIADVSGKNPNVNYELGVSHAFKRRAVIISQSIEDVPFDYRHLKVVIYDRGKDGWTSELSENVTESLRAVRDEAREELEKDGSKIALIGNWVGTLNQETDNGPITEETEMALAATSAGEICGRWILHSAARIGYEIIFDVTCTTFSDRYIKLDFVSADKKIMTFGTLMVRLSGNARTMKGQYVGYGSVSDRIVNGAVTLNLALDPT